jgi:branched-chain amino acid transport system permease protein
MPFVETPKLNIHYRSAGTGDTAIVFLHGNYASSRWWEPLLSSLPGGYRGFAPDLRGCGSRKEHSTRSGALTRRLSIQDLAQDLDDFLLALELERAVILGHSFGGLVATTFSIQHPQKVIALVLEDTGPAKGISLGSLTTPLLLPLEIKNRGMFRRALHRVGIPKTGQFSKDLVEDALSAPRGLYYKFSRAAAAWKAEDGLSRISAPTLLIWGENDDVMPSKFADAYLKDIPDARLVLIPDAGHSPHFEQPEKFTEALYTFLDHQIQAGRNHKDADPRLDENKGRVQTAHR